MLCSRAHGPFKHQTLAAAAGHTAAAVRHTWFVQTAALCDADVVPEFNPANPEDMAESIDRKISLMRQQSVDPAFDQSRPEADRLQYMTAAPGTQPEYNSLGLAGFRGGNGSSAGGPTSTGAPRRTVEWVPHSSTREKLESWVQPGATNDAGNNRTLMKQFSKDERT